MELHEYYCYANEMRRMYWINDQVYACKKRHTLAGNNTSPVNLADHVELCVAVGITDIVKCCYLLDCIMRFHVISRDWVSCDPNARIYGAIRRLLENASA